MIPKVAVVILAAGASTRMGVPKQLLPWGNKSLLNHVIHTASTMDLQIHVVLGANSRMIQEALPSGDHIHVHTNPYWDTGLGSSIAFAVKNLEHDKLDGILFLLADQPFISSTYLEEMRAHFKENTSSIIVSKFNGNLGVPAIFSSEYFNELETLNADVGAKQIIKMHVDKVLKLDADRYVRDIDTLEDYRDAHKAEFGATPSDL
ncbi:nucleotidyltransferase family protein [Galbibacter sp.]|jgi:molybdenum cofactor cytidylyltransferase|uniref:nucleotidyltransferase family protein n=1 Tax=Galbibacter sp. TaxID=2918471 RepID=UPI003A9099C0